MTHTSAGDRWRARLRRPDGSVSQRVASQEVERDFWRERTQNGLPAPDAYADRVWDALAALCEGVPIQSVLEIGPGWGNYTFRLCARFASVTAVDISPDNLRALTDEAARRGLRLNAVCAPWEEAAVDKHDLVFAYNCFYRLTEPEWFFHKVNAAARRLCVVGMNRPPELPWLADMAAAGLPVHYTHQGCEEMREVLESLGIGARRVDIPNERRYFYADEAALLARARQFLLSPCPDEALLPLLLPYHTRLDDGRLVNVYAFRSQLLVWEPVNQPNTPFGIGI